MLAAELQDWLRGFRQSDLRMKYYDNECPAHNALKLVAKDLSVEGILTVYFTPQIVGGAAA